MKYVINEGQRALVFKEGKLVDYLKEGTYNNFGFFNKIFDVHECEGQLKSEKKLAKLQRELSRKTIGSNNRNKARIKVARCHEKITNQRKDFLHKLSTKLIKNYDVICLETLKVKNMVKNHKLAKVILDVSWSEFVRQIGYKADWYGKVKQQIDTYYASSQICGECGYKNSDTKDLSVREWICPQCGKHHDRDENASNNILKEGLRLLSV